MKLWQIVEDTTDKPVNKHLLYNDHAAALLASGDGQRVEIVVKDEDSVYHPQFGEGRVLKLNELPGVSVYQLPQWIVVWQSGGYSVLNEVLSDLEYLYP